MNLTRFIVYSDYLCPWCFNASVRLRRLETEYAGQLELEWRSYLLRPEPRTFSDPKAALEKFRSYSEGWLRVGEDGEGDGGTFQVWSSDAGPPVSSIPAHGVSKAARALGPDAFGAMHDRLLRAYFGESQDISSPGGVEGRCGRNSAFPEKGFDLASQPETVMQIRSEFRGAQEAGATGVPAVQLEGNPAIIVGAHPSSLYRRWIERTLQRERRTRDPVPDREETAWLSKGHADRSRDHPQGYGTDSRPLGSRTEVQDCAMLPVAFASI